MNARTACLLALVGLLSAPPPALAQVALSEILYDPAGVNTGRQALELRNYGSAEASVGGYWLYFPPSQWQFPAGASVPAGGTIVVYLNRSGKNTETEFYTGLSGIQSLKAEDAIALFRSNLFSDPTQLADFVQWGSSGHGAEHVAVSAGLWPPFGFVDTRSLREGSSIAYDGSGDAPSDWCVDGTPTIGSPNDACTPSFARSPVVVSEIGYFRGGPGDYHPAVEFLNAGGILEDLGGKWVVFGGTESYQFPLGNPDTILAPGERIVLHVGVDGPDGPYGFYTGAGGGRDFRPADSVSFHAGWPFADATTLIDFVQWGAAGSPLEAAAVEAGLWSSGEFVDASRRVSRGSFVRVDPLAGPANWAVDNTPSFGAPNDAPPASPVALNEILIDPPGTEPGNGAVELKNVLAGEDFVSEGLTLCTASPEDPGSLACFTVPEGTTIPAGGLLVVRLGADGSPEPGTVYSGPFPELSPAGGILLLSLRPEALDADNLIDYVRWGDGSTAWEDLADGRGLWPGDAAVGTGWARDGTSIAYWGTGRGAEAYRLDLTPTIGRENAEEAKDEPFRRGDCNDDARTDISDAIRIFGFLFLGVRAPLCRDACDSNDDGVLDISDPVYVLNYLFLSGPAMPAPGAGGTCGGDPTPDPLSCDSFISCAP